MKRIHLLFLMIALCAASALAKPSDYIYEVGMSLNPEANTVEESGSAVLLDPQSGIYITAYHTIRKGPAGSKLMVDVLGVLRGTRLIAISKLHDLALFQGPVRPGAEKLPKLEIAVAAQNEAAQATSLAPTLNGMQPTERVGTVLQTSYWTLLTSSKGERGMSGGGIFAGDKLIGIITDMDEESEQIIGRNANAIQFFIEVSKDANSKKPYDADKDFKSLVGSK